jgi:hypothetical protein
VSRHSPNSQNANPLVSATSAFWLRSPSSLRVVATIADGTASADLTIRRGGRLRVGREVGPIKGDSDKSRFAPALICKKNSPLSEQIREG